MTDIKSQKVNQSIRETGMKKTLKMPVSQQEGTRTTLCRPLIGL